jgi:hypothetical protein
VQRGVEGVSSQPAGDSFQSPNTAGDVSPLKQHVPERVARKVEQPQPHSHPHNPHHPSARQPQSRYIPRPVCRAVASRDQYRCAYVSPDGYRCTQTSDLEFHHRQPYARGGTATIAGLELRCRCHNDMQARLDFGEAHMARVKQQRRVRCLDGLDGETA